MRSLVFGDESRYRRDLGYHVSICTVPNHLGLDHAGRFYNEPNRTIGVYSARDNTEAKALFWFASPAIDYDHRDVEQQRRIVEETFSGCGWVIEELPLKAGNAITLKEYAAVRSFALTYAAELAPCRNAVNGTSRDFKSLDVPFTDLR